MMNNKLSTKIEALKQILGEIEKESHQRTDLAEMSDLSELSTRVDVVEQRLDLVEASAAVNACAPVKERKPRQKFNGFTQVEDLPLSNHIINALRDAAVWTVGDLKMLTTEDLLGINRLGVGRVDEIIEMCDENNIQLKQV